MSADFLRRNLGSFWSANLTLSSLPTTSAISAFLGGSLQPRQSRPATSSIFSTSACNHPFWSGNIGAPGNLGENRGDLGNLAKICILGNLCSPRKVGRHSPSQSWQFRSAYLALSSLPATSAVSAILGGRLCDHVNTVWQPRHFFLSQHAIKHSRPAKSVIPAILGDSLGDLGSLGNICILGNSSNLCSLCNFGRQSPLQSQQS